MKELEIENLLDLNQTIAKKIFENIKYGWEAIPKISELIYEIGDSLNKKKYDKIDGNIWVSKAAKIAATCCIIGPCIIDEGVEIRHAAYIRENVIIGKRCVVRKLN